MKKCFKNGLTLILAVVMLLTGVLFIPQQGSTVEAASKPYINPYSTRVYYLDSQRHVSTTSISIMNCSKASQIKNLKSSNTSVAYVIARQGYIDVYSHKAGKATISCTVNGTKLKTTVTVKSYSNPVSSFKVGNTQFKSKFVSTSEYDWYHTSKVSKKNIVIKAAKNWKITRVSYSINGSHSYTTVNKKSSYTLKSKTLNKSYDYIDVTFYNTKTKASLTIDFTSHKE